MMLFRLIVAADHEEACYRHLGSRQRTPELDICLTTGLRGGPVIHEQINFVALDDGENRGAVDFDDVAAAYFGRSHDAGRSKLQRYGADLGAKQPDSLVIRNACCLVSVAGHIQRSFVCLPTN